VFTPYQAYASTVGTPIAPSTPVLMIASRDLKQYSQAGLLPPVPSGHVFWANSRQVQLLVQGGMAVIAPPGTAAPPAEPPWTANWIPGIGKGTTNCSH
jgi:hypothetical protein